MQLPWRSSLFVALAVIGCEPITDTRATDALAVRWADAHVAWIERCEIPGSIHGEFGARAEPLLSGVNLDRAHERRREQFRDDAADADQALQREAFERCVRALVVEPCVDAPAYDAFTKEHGCDEVFVGSHGLGEACEIHRDCGPDMFCDERVIVDPAADGSCALLAGIGDFCFARACRDGLVCEQIDADAEPRCALPHEAGGSCVTDDDCAASLGCVERTCVVLPDVAEPCARRRPEPDSFELDSAPDAGRCATGLHCVDDACVDFATIPSALGAPCIDRCGIGEFTGVTCDVDLGRCVERVVVDVGDACDPGLRPDRYCVSARAGVNACIEDAKRPNRFVCAPEPCNGDPFGVGADVTCGF